jgi:hypothetical protein
LCPRKNEQGGRSFPPSSKPAKNFAWAFAAQDFSQEIGFCQLSKTLCPRKNEQGGCSSPPSSKPAKNFAWAFAAQDFSQEIGFCQLF